MGYIDPTEVHYRIVESRSSAGRASVVCVQDFDYDDYDGFITEELFATEEEALEVADKANNRPWHIRMLAYDKATVLEEAAYAIAEENPYMDKATDVSGWMRDRAQKIRWGLL